VESIPGQGATFAIRIPIDGLPREEAASTDPRSPVPTAA
jgi:hypothetical protein